MHSSMSEAKEYRFTAFGLYQKRDELMRWELSKLILHQLFDKEAARPRIPEILEYFQFAMQARSSSESRYIMHFGVSLCQLLERGVTTSLGAFQHDIRNQINSIKRDMFPLNCRQSSGWLIDQLKAHLKQYFEICFEDAIAYLWRVQTPKGGGSKIKPAFRKQLKQITTRWCEIIIVPNIKRGVHATTSKTGLLQVFQFSEEEAAAIQSKKCEPQLKKKFIEELKFLKYSLTLKKSLRTIVSHYLRHDAAIFASVPDLPSEEREGEGEPFSFWKLPFSGNPEISLDRILDGLSEIEFRSQNLHPLLELNKVSTWRYKEAVQNQLQKVFKLTEPGYAGSDGLMSRSKSPGGAEDLSSLRLSTFTRFSTPAAYAYTSGMKQI